MKSSTLVNIAFAVPLHFFCEAEQPECRIGSRPHVDLARSSPARRSQIHDPRHGNVIGSPLDMRCNFQLDGRMNSCVGVLKELLADRKTRFALSRPIYRTVRSAFCNSPALGGRAWAARDRPFSCPHQFGPAGTAGRTAKNPEPPNHPGAPWRSHNFQRNPQIFLAFSAGLKFSRIS